MIIVLLQNLIRAYQLILVVYAISSWFPDIKNSTFGNFLRQVTEPVLAPIREFLRRNVNLQLPIDISMLVLYFGLSIVSILLSAFY